jgi:hypothetical protein
VHRRAGGKKVRIISDDRAKTPDAQACRHLAQALLRHIDRT